MINFQENFMKFWSYGLCLNLAFFQLLNCLTKVLFCGK